MARGEKAGLVNEPAALDRLIAAMVSMNLPGRAELYRAVRAKRILVLEVSARDAQVATWMLKPQEKPVIVLVCDDDYRSTGPGAWLAAPKVIRWAAKGVVHGSGGDAPTYKLAIDLAVACRRLLLIETSSEHAAAWGEKLLSARRPVPCIGFLPAGNGQHPIAPDRRAAH